MKRRKQEEVGGKEDVEGIGRRWRRRQEQMGVGSVGGLVSERAGGQSW